VSGFGPTPEPDAAAHAFVVNSLAARAQSVEEIERKLAARGVPPDVARAVVDEVVRLGYLNDPELAAELARGYRARRYGRHRAAAAMHRRYLDAAMVDEALDEAYGDADEAQLAVEALGSRAVTDAGDRRRAVSFLVRRGFSPGAAWRAVRSRADDPG
jgi:SOS response regulatory protein OraA/RecX